MITVEVDKADLRRVYNALGKIGNDAPKVICRGINKTASSSKTQLSERARAVYTVKSGKFFCKNFNPSIFLILLSFYYIKKIIFICF